MENFKTDNSEALNEVINKFDNLSVLKKKQMAINALNSGKEYTIEKMT